MTRHRLLHAAVILLLAVVVMSAPAAASSHLATVSSHTTASEFQAGSLDGVLVDGTGASGYVYLQKGDTIDGFEDQNLNEYSGDTGQASFSSTTGVTQGSFSLNITNTNCCSSNPEITSTSGLPGYFPDNSTYIVDVHTGSDVGGLQEGAAVFFGYQDSNNWYKFYLNEESNDIGINELDGGGSSIGRNSTSGVPISNDEQYTIEIERHTGSDEITARLLNDAGTEIGVVTTTEDPALTDDDDIGFTLYENDFNTYSAYFDNARVRQGSDTGTYLSPNHSVDNASVGWTNLTLDNATATVTWQHASSGTWSTVASTTYSTSGNRTLSLTGDGPWRVNVTLQSTTATFTAQLHDEGVQFDPTPPVIDNSSMQPSGGTTITSQNPTFTVEINDTDFGLVQGDELTAELYIDGQLEGTDTLTSNGTASVTTSAPSGGSHTYHWEVQDDWGQQDASQTLTVNAPGTLYIRNETAPTTLVDEAEVEIQFYFQNSSTSTADLIVTRNTSDGTVNMTGLPSDQPFVVVANADGYHNRRIYVDTLLSTQTVYLLPTSQPAVEPTFTLEDYTGRFPAEDTVMMLQRGLANQSGVVDWRTVEADYFGATDAFPTTLREGARHRVILLNTETGDRRIKGKYTPVAGGLQTVVVQTDGTIQIVQPDAIVSIAPSTRSLPAQDPANVTVDIQERDGTVSSWTTTITLTNTSGTSTLVTDTGSSAGSTMYQLNLTNATGTVNVTVDYSLQSGASDTETAEFGVTTVYNNQYSLLSVLGTIPVRLPTTDLDAWTSMIAVILTVLFTAATASVVPASTETLGVVALGFLAGFAVIGWLGYGLVFVAGVGWVALAGLRRGI